MTYVPRVQTDKIQNRQTPRYYVIHFSDYCILYKINLFFNKLDTEVSTTYPGSTTHTFKSDKFCERYHGRQLLIIVL